jgi:cell division protein FtsQ
MSRPAERRARVDPRVRARRVAVLRAQGRRRRRVLLAVLAVGAVAAGVWAVVQSPLLDVDRIAVHGARNAEAADIRRAAGVDRGDPIAVVDTGDVEQRVEQVAWVREAHVRRELPGRVVITLEERVPVAWSRRDAATVALVDGDGRVLADSPWPPEGLPELVELTIVPGAGGQVVPRAGARLVASVPAALRERAAIVTGDAGATTAHLDGGIEVRFGRAVDGEEKGRAALAVLETLGDRWVAYIDVRVPTAPVTG